MTNEERAQKLTDYFFTNGWGERATRLVLELPGKRDGGGWCKSAIVDKIAAALDEAEKRGAAAKDKEIEALSLSYYVLKRKYDDLLL